MNARTHAAAPLAVLFALAAMGCERGWSEEEKAMLAELRLTPEASSPADPSNQYANSEAAAALGQRFFFDARFSSNGKVSCATCHLPQMGFQDGVPLAKGVGTTPRRTMPLTGVASATWFFWDGRKDSLWSQALGPLESPVEHGGDRAQYAWLIATSYRSDYETVFGPLPSLADVPKHASPNADGEVLDAWLRLSGAQKDAVNRIFANLGKALAAYQGTLQPGETRFDQWVDAVLTEDVATAERLFSADERAGLRLFLGKANCTECHNGPLLSNGDFANTGVPPSAQVALPDRGRLDGVAEALADEFNCLGRYSDAPPEACGELRALHHDDHTLRQFKVPSLRGVAERAPYMHAGQMATLEEVLSHYDRAPAARAGHTELRPLHLTARERQQLHAFLLTLSAPPAGY